MGHDGELAGRQRPRGDVALGLDRGGDQNAGLDHELPLHVDDVIPEEGRPGRCDVTRGKPAEDLGNAVGDRSDRRHGDRCRDARVRLGGSVRDLRCAVHGHPFGTVWQLAARPAVSRYVSRSVSRGQQARRAIRTDPALCAGRTFAVTRLACRLSGALNARSSTRFDDPAGSQARL
jgi:hypothetical protein